jgi:hypothetical protein
MTKRESIPEPSKVRNYLRDLNSDAVTLFCIHSAELCQTALYHPDLWTGLHTALSIGLAVASVRVLAKLGNRT